MEPFILKILADAASLTNKIKKYRAELIDCKTILHRMVNFKFYLI